MRTESSLEKYLAETFPPQGTSEVYDCIEKALKADGKWGIQISRSDARILQFLLSVLGAKRVVEIGTLYGFSTYAMASVLPKFGELHTVDSSPEHQQKAITLLAPTEERKKIHFHLGTAMEVLPQLSPRGPFDVIFIDANKGAYLDYLDWAEGVMRPGGLIVADNTLLFGEVHQAEGLRSDANREKMQKFNRRLADPSKWNSVLIPTGEGLTVAQRRSGVDS